MLDSKKDTGYNEDELRDLILKEVTKVIGEIFSQPPNLDNGIKENNEEPFCTPEKITLSVEETAAVLGVSRATAYELVKRQDFPSFRIGNRILVKRAALDRWLEAQPSAAQ